MEGMSFKAFMKGEALPVEDREVVVSKRFLDEGGKPIPWKIRAISQEENNALQEDCIEMKPAPGKAGRRGQMRPVVNMSKYGVALAAACVVYPDLANKELQETYGVMDAASLLSVMLMPGEMVDLQTEVNDICGFQTFDEQVEEVKNS